MPEWMTRADLLIFSGAHAAYSIFCLLMLFGWLPAAVSPLWLFLGTVATLALGYVDYRLLMMQFGSALTPHGPVWPQLPLWVDIPLKLYVILHAILIAVLALTGGVAVMTLLVAGYFTV